MQTPIHAEALARALRTQLRQADLDHTAFGTPLRRCQLDRCRATCCHDGVVLDTLEIPLLEAAAARHADRFRTYGIDLSQPLFDRGQASRPRTATRPAAAADLAPDFPSHFPRTRCAFLDGMHRCTWQRLAEDLGSPPWHYKPLSCWMHPVVLQASQGNGRPPLLTLAGAPDDPDDFATATPCGRPSPGGHPARETLSRELALLGAIAGRDFLAELAAPP